MSVLATGKRGQRVWLQFLRKRRPRSRDPTSHGCDLLHDFLQDVGSADPSGHLAMILVKLAWGHDVALQIREGAERTDTGARLPQRLKLYDIMQRKLEELQNTTQDFYRRCQQHHTNSKTRASLPEFGSCILGICYAALNGYHGDMQRIMRTTDACARQGLP